MTNDALLEPLCQEIATFLRAPHRPDLSGVDIARYGVPYDGGVRAPPNEERRPGHGLGFGRRDAR